LIARLAFVFLFGAATPAVAAPNITETIKYYTVSGNSFAAIRRDMARRGPKGYWGLTSWWITWSARCEIDLDITITMPRLTASSRLSAYEKRVWRGMVDALYRHEQLHAQHGRQAAAEIHRTRCQNPKRVVEKWAERDRVLDRSTRHGATQGVTLPD